jgi:hypothetical protein
MAKASSGSVPLNLYLEPAQVELLEKMNHSGAGSRIMRNLQRDELEAVSGGVVALSHIAMNAALSHIAMNAALSHIAMNAVLKR